LLNRVWPIPEAKSTPTLLPVARASVNVANWLSEGSLVALIPILAFSSSSDDTAQLNLPPPFER